MKHYKFSQYRMKTDEIQINFVIGSVITASTTDLHCTYVYAIKHTLDTSNKPHILYIL